jgi:hypothetical protein
MSIENLSNFDRVLVPEAAPREVRCSPLSPESLQISWQPPPEERVHGIIQGYRLYYEAVLEELGNYSALHLIFFLRWRP